MPLRRQHHGISAAAHQHSREAGVTVPLRRQRHGTFALMGIAVALILAACSSTGPSSQAGSGSGGATELSDCERDRLAAALGVEEVSLPLEPEDEPLADIARDICALDGSADSIAGDAEGGASALEQAAGSPVQQRDAALPAALVRAPSLFDPADVPPGEDAYLDGLWIACGQGSASACNALLFESSPGSDYEAFAFSCGGRENLHCSVLLGDADADAGLLGFDFGPDSPAPGNVAELDGWWTECRLGSARGCAQLVLSAPGGSLYASFGWTCGGRTTRDCALAVGDDGTPPALAGRSPQDLPPGDDEYLDQLWRLCGAADATACRDLATFGTPGSDYERFALSCGWRAVRACARLFTELSSETPDDVPAEP